MPEVGIIHQIFKKNYMLQFVGKYSLLKVYQLYNVPQNPSSKKEICVHSPFFKKNTVLIQIS
jgi:hypothetical protein